MILSDKYIRGNNIVSPFHTRTVFRGMSFGLSSCGYDVRANLSSLDEWYDYGHVQTPDGDGIRLQPGKSVLISIIEHFNMPLNVVGFTNDKSTWARQGLSVGRCVIEPGWKGYLSLRLVNQGEEALTIIQGDPITQIVFHWIDSQPEKTYTGKYQGQQQGPQGPRFEE